METRRLCGKTTIDDNNGAEYELTMWFDYAEWREAHPYGETVAYESMAEVSNEEFELDGESVTRERLDIVFGLEAAEKAVNRAIENGE